MNSGTGVWGCKAARVYSLVGTRPTQLDYWLIGSDAKLTVDVGTSVNSAQTIIIYVKVQIMIGGVEQSYLDVPVELVIHVCSDALSCANDECLTAITGNTADKVLNGPMASSHTSNWILEINGDICKDFYTYQYGIDGTTYPYNAAETEENQKLLTTSY